MKMKNNDEEDLKSSDKGNEKLIEFQLIDG
jgi:hypothetical protein